MNEPIPSFPPLPRYAEEEYHKEGGDRELYALVLEFDRSMRGGLSLNNNESLDEKHDRIEATASTCARLAERIDALICADEGEESVKEIAVREINLIAHILELGADNIYSMSIDHITEFVQTISVHWEEALIMLNLVKIARGAALDTGISYFNSDGTYGAGKRVHHIHISDLLDTLEHIRSTLQRTPTPIPDSDIVDEYVPVCTQIKNTVETIIQSIYQINTVGDALHLVSLKLEDSLMRIVASLGLSENYFYSKSAIRTRQDEMTQAIYLKRQKYAR